MPITSLKLKCILEEYNEKNFIGYHKNLTLWIWQCARRALIYNNEMPREYFQKLNSMQQQECFNWNKKEQSNQMNLIQQEKFSIKNNQTKSNQIKSTEITFNAIPSLPLRLSRTTNSMPYFGDLISTHFFNSLKFSSNWSDCSLSVSLDSSAGACSTCCEKHQLTY